MIRFQVNGKPVNLDVATDTPLLWVLRDELGMTGTKFGCGMALCGACTVYLDGTAIRACSTPVSAVSERSVTTIEDLHNDPVGQVVQQAWVDNNVAQCGYCQPGQIMSATHLLKSNPAPNHAQIDSAMSGNICRCGTYPRIHQAIVQASTRLTQGKQ